jgi:hypothetical protein
VRGKGGLFEGWKCIGVVVSCMKYGRLGDGLCLLLSNKGTLLFMALDQHKIQLNALSFCNFAGVQSLLRANSSSSSDKAPLIGFEPKRSPNRPS